MNAEESGLLNRAGPAGKSVQLDELHRELRRLRLATGQPSLRVIAQKIGWSRATVGRVFTGETAPKWDVLSAVVGHLGGDTEEFRPLWMNCMDQGGQETGVSGPVLDEPAPLVAEKPQRKLSSYVAVVCSVLFLLVVSAQGLAPANGFQNQEITDSAQLAFGALAAGSWALVYARTKERRALAFTLGLAGWSLGQAYWLTMRDVFDHPIPDAPSFGDLSYLLLPACVLPGFVATLPHTTRRPWAGVLGALISSTTAAAVLALLASANGPVGAAAVYSLYAITDLAMLVLFFRLGRQERSLYLGAAAAGTAALLFADSLFDYFAWWRPESSIPYGADIGYIVFPLGMIVAASLALEKR